jgi:transcriptional regulator with XRE-family HTH domain
MKLNPSAVAAARKTKKLTVDQIATSIGKSRPYTSRLINGKDDIQESTLVWLSALLDKSKLSLISEASLSPEQQLKLIEQEERSLQRRKERIVQSIEKGGHGCRKENGSLQAGK